MIIGTWEEDIKRLVDLKEDRMLHETDIEDVAEYYNEKNN